MVGKSEIAGTTAAPDLWSQFWGPVRHLGRQVGEMFAPSSEATGAKDAYEIKLELPGVKDADISIEAHDNRLTIIGKKEAKREESGTHFYFSERVYGGFQRSFQLPEDADTSAIKATHEDGLLTVRIPRKNATESAPRQIAINT